MRVHTIVTGITAATLACGLLAPPLGVFAAAGAKPKYRVTYGLPGLLGAYRYNNDLKSSPPGSNDWRCKPSTAHPRPVVLVHGAGVTQAVNWRTFAPLLANNGYCVFSLNYGVAKIWTGDRRPGVARMEKSATKDLKPFIAKVLSATGATKVDLVGHSEGTIMPRWYIKFLGGHTKVDKFVNLAPAWKGSDGLGQATLYNAAVKLGLKPIADPIADNVFFPRGRGTMPGSDYLKKVNAPPAFPRRVSYTSIVTRYDEAVAPYTSGIAPPGPNITNIVLQDKCPTNTSEHALLGTDPVVGQLILNALDPANAQPVRCHGVPRGSG